MKFVHVGASPTSTLSTSVSGESTEERADQHQQQLRHQVDEREDDVDAGRLLGAEDVDRGQQGDHCRAEDDVAGRRPQGLPEQPADVVRHEERRDRDGDRVVEHLRPGGEERDELVERAPGEARRAACLRVHRRRLGVRGGRPEEEDARDDEHHRRQAECERGHQPERVVDRRPDVPVRRREQRVDAEDSLETF